MKRFKNILLVTDLKPKNNNALHRAITLAHRNKARLTIMEIIENGTEQSPEAFPFKKQNIIKKWVEKKKLQLDDKIEAIQDKDLTITAQIRTGRPFLEIIQKVLCDGHDLVMVPAEGKTRFSDNIYGSTSMHLMRKCPCPVWIIKPERQRKYYRILAAVDLDEFGRSPDLLNRKIMDLATSLAQWFKSQLHVVYAWTIFGENFLEGVSHEEIRKLESKVQRDFRTKMRLFLSQYDLKNISNKLHINKGPAKIVIPTLVEKQKIDLIIMGTVCRTGIEGFFIGNTAEGTLQQVNCSVLTVKPDKFVSPVKGNR